MKVLTLLAGLFSKSVNAVQGVVNPEELLKAVLTAVTSGSATSLLAALAAIIPAIPVFIPNPAISGLVVAILVLLLDLYRRKNQGVDPSDVHSAIVAKKIIAATNDHPVA